MNVKNHLPGESCTIHWHGIHQVFSSFYFNRVWESHHLTVNLITMKVGTPYMDGVPLVTQCPISPASSFRYNFIAENPGTHFYHSHSGEFKLLQHRSFQISKFSFRIGFQRADGVFGSLIVRQSKQSDPQSALYDYDLPEHVMLVSDWLGEFLLYDL